MGGRQRAAALCLCAALAATLCACRAAWLPDGSAFAIARELCAPPAAASCEESGEAQPLAHEFAARQSEEVQDLFAWVYAAICDFQTRIVLPEGVTRAQVEAVDDLLYLDCPELFHFSHLSSYTYLQSDPDHITEVEADYCMTRAQYARALDEVEAVVAPWVEETRGLSDYEKQLYAHDALIRRCAYDLDGAHAGSIYGALALGKARCQGYANAMTYLLRRMGVPCLYLYGEAGGESHAWNAVCVEGTWALCDATWDDPVGERDALTHAYFNLNDALMGRSHTLDPGFALQGVPACDSLAWNACVRQGTFAAKGEDARALAEDWLAEALAAGETQLAMQFATPEQLQTVAGDLAGLMRAASERAGVFPAGSSYCVDEKANHLEWITITYE